MQSRWQIQVVDERVLVGERFSIAFQRTLRIPDDGRAYPLPPSMGPFPVRRVEDYADRLPAEWRQRGGVFIPMYQREALWLAFSGAWWKPNAVKIGLGGVDALTGEAWDEALRAEPQNYLVCPQQPWLDGINAGNGVIRQFVAMPLGAGYSVEGQLTGQERYGGIQVLVFEPRPGVFPDEPPPPPPPEQALMFTAAPGLGGVAAMGLGAGGQITQKIYPDEFGLHVWDQSQHASLWVHILNSEQYTSATGEPPPPTPVSAHTYTEFGFPWFELYDADQESLRLTQKLSTIKSIHQLDQECGARPDGVDAPVDIAAEQLHPLDLQEVRRKDADTRQTRP